MKIGEHIFFSSRLKYSELKNLEDSEWCNCFFERLNDFYIVPAKMLDDTNLGFSSLILSFSAIEAFSDLISDHAKPGLRFVDGAITLKLFSKNEAGKIYGIFRSGLVHHGKIKDGMLSSYDISEMVFTSNGEIIINPRILRDKFSHEMIQFSKSLQTQEKVRIGKRIKGSFEKDLDF